MRGFERFFQAERIKWRRDWTLLVVLLAPFTQTCILCLIVWFSEDRATLLGSGFPVWYKINYLIWNLVTMPISIALISALSWDLEEKNRTWTHLLSQPVPRFVHYLVKLTSHFSLFLLAQILLVMLLIVGGLFLRANVPALRMGTLEPSIVLRFVGFSLVASLPISSFHAWFSTWFPSLGASLAVALGGSLFAFQMAARWPMNGILPWGLAVQTADIVMRAKLPPMSLYLSALFCALILAALGTLDFCRRTEVMDRRG